MLQGVSDTCERFAALSPLLGGITPLCQSQCNATISTVCMGTSNAKKRSTRSDHPKIERSRIFHMIKTGAKVMLEIGIKPVWWRHRGTHYFNPDAPWSDRKGTEFRLPACSSEGWRNVRRPAFRQITSGPCTNRAWRRVRRQQEAGKFGKLWLLQRQLILVVIG